MSWFINLAENIDFSCKYKLAIFIWAFINALILPAQAIIILKSRTKKK